MKKHVYGQLAVGTLAMIALVVGSAAPSHAWRQGGHAVVGSHVVGGPRAFVGPRVFGGPRFFGPRVFVGAPYWYPYRAYYPYYAPAFAPAVVDPPTPVYVQPNPPAQYWYYCQNPQGYYPYVQQCPGGWMQVVPNSTTQ